MTTIPGIAASGRLYGVVADGLHGAPLRSLFFGLDDGFPLHAVRFHAAVQAMRAVWVRQLRASKPERWRARVVPFLFEELIPRVGGSARTGVAMKRSCPANNRGDGK